MSLPSAIYSAAQVRALDRYAIETLNIPGYALMRRAGAAALSALQRSWPQARRITLVCGPGNNGGDGYVLARLAREAHMEVLVMSVGDPARLRGDAARAHQDFVAAGGTVREWDVLGLEKADVVVDAIFGIGLSRPIEDAVEPIISAMNAARVPILALDIPSGLNSDSGAVLGCAVHAQRTLTFIGLKPGFFLGSGPDCVGTILFDALGLPESAFAEHPPVALRVNEELLTEIFPPRLRTAHKGLYGHVLIIGGGLGMAGAARLAGEAALRCGAGRVTVATHPEHVSSIIAGRPELMCRGVTTSAQLEPLLRGSDVVAIGPGLGRDEWARAMLQATINSDRPAVLDADALNILAELSLSAPVNGRWVLTPHPAEAGRLLGWTSAQVQKDRLTAVRSIAAQHRSTVVLKGAASLIAAPTEPIYICDHGNPGMASAGMGDVLTGVIAAIAAQFSDLTVAARAGVLVHAMAGDRAAASGERGMIASDLFEYLRTCVNPNRRA
jgi:ADP-dependent NAD(P)H-hydrate dehydratase / NAD(P)H-hydrate epimerase